MQANQSFGSMCQQILNNGYQPLPFNGKQVVVEGWATCDINSRVVDSWSSTYQNNNLGIRTGQGLNPVFGADFDFFDKAVVERVTQAFVSRFGEGLIRR